MANLGEWPAWIVFCFVCTCVQAGVYITGCDGVDGGGMTRGRYAEVNLENEQYSFSCTRILSTHTALWKLKDNDAGTCPPPNSTLQDSCDPGLSLLKPVLTPRRTSYTESVMTVRLRPYPRVLDGNAKLHCQEQTPERSISSRDSCSVDLIRPADGKCQGEFMTSSQPWTVYVRCDVTSGNSSMGMYKCRLRQSLQGQAGKDLVGWTDMEENTLPTGSAVCNLNVPLNTSIQGPQRYAVQLLPGSRVVDVTFSGNDQIRRPDPPSVKCSPSGLVPENSNLTCRCTADNIGLPQGHLRWSQSVSDGRFDTNRPLRMGKTGKAGLKLVTTLQREDHDVTMFRCDVVWARDVTGNVKTAEVGYAASQVEFSLNNQDKPVKENTTITFSCTARDGRPSPTLTLKRADGTEMADAVSPLTHHSKVRCEDSGVFACTAGNGMGLDRTQTTTLNVTCKPRDIQSGPIQPVNYQGDETGFSFELVSNPAPYKVSFLFLGSQETNSPSKVKDIALSGQCQPRKGVTYISSCRVIVDNVTSSAAAGLYRVNVRNQRGSMNFVFEVKVNATMPDPSAEEHTVIVAAAVAGVVAVSALVTVIAIVICRRKTDSDKSPGHNNAVKYNAAENGREGGAGSRLPPTSHSASKAEQPLLADADEDSPAQPTKLSDTAPKGDYAPVQKSKMAGSADKIQVADSNGEQPDYLYAVVDKTKKNKKGEESPLLSSVLPPARSEVKDSGDSPAQGEEFSEAPLYGNIDVRDEVAKRQNADSPAPKEADRGQELNPDGLLYVSVDFSDKPPPASQPRPTVRDDGVLYSDIDFSRTAPAQ